MAPAAAPKTSESSATGPPRPKETRLAELAAPEALALALAPAPLALLRMELAAPPAAVETEAATEEAPEAAEEAEEAAAAVDMDNPAKKVDASAPGTVVTPTPEREVTTSEAEGVGTEKVDTSEAGMVVATPPMVVTTSVAEATGVLATALPLGHDPAAGAGPAEEQTWVTRAFPLAAFVLPQILPRQSSIAETSVVEAQ